MGTMHSPCHPCDQQQALLPSRGPGQRHVLRRTMVRVGSLSANKENDLSISSKLNGLNMSGERAK